MIALDSRVIRPPMPLGLGCMDISLPHGQALCKKPGGIAQTAQSTKAHDGENGEPQKMDQHGHDLLCSIFVLLIAYFSYGKNKNGT